MRQNSLTFPLILEKKNFHSLRFLTQTVETLCTISYTHIHPRTHAHATRTCQENSSTFFLIHPRLQSPPRVLLQTAQESED